MEVNSSSSEESPGTPLPTRKPTKRLLFDRRYGWIFDEWTDPSDEALAGGRGMFCVFPIAKSLVNAFSQSMGLAAESVVKVVNSPNQFSPQELQANLCSHFHKLAHNARGLNRTLLNLGRDYPNDKQHNTMQSTEDPTN
ncbi:hypothetical protein Cni_G05237 [Canna indica]|uniref:Uncharacterized protein n=1 Tax=Canna indica TaxID=4628 RepID=A0AAQ3JYQ5_9LILI|nr:hypothetical protein Cni_G05237 [Canna indica]